LLEFLDHSFRAAEEAPLYEAIVFQLAFVWADVYQDYSRRQWSLRCCQALLSATAYTLKKNTLGLELVVRVVQNFLSTG
jgi:hypothetical protein